MALHVTVKARAAVKATNVYGVGKVVGIPSTHGAGTISVSSEPLFVNGANQTLLWHGLTDAANPRYSSATAAGVGDNYTGKMFRPGTCPYFTGDPVDTTANQISQNGGMTGGIAFVHTYPTAGPVQIAADWVLVNDTPITDARYFVFTRYVKFVSTPITELFQLKWARIFTVGAGGGGAPQYSTAPPTNAGYPAGITTVQETLNNGYEELSDNQGQQPLRPYLQDCFDGAWHRETFLYISHSAVDNYSRGRQAMWRDGVLIMDVCLNQVDQTPSSGTKTYCDLGQVQHMAVSDPVSSLGFVSLGGVSVIRPSIDVVFYTDLNSSYAFLQD